LTSPELKQNLILDIEEKILASAMSAIFKINKKQNNNKKRVLGKCPRYPYVPGFIKIPIAVVEIFATADARTYERPYERTYNDHFNMLSVLPDNMKFKVIIIKDLCLFAFSLADLRARTGFRLAALWCDDE
jgi:hypothetical protein